MESRARLSLAEKAKIIELYLYGQMNIYDLADLFSISPIAISRTVSLYFKKPKKDVVKMSKV